MASIYKRKNKDGTSVWRTVVRIKGYPTVCNHFDRKQEADDWAKETERKIKVGQFNFDQYKKQYTFKELFDCFISDGALEHHKSKADTLRHFDLDKIKESKSKREIFSFLIPRSYIGASIQKLL